MANDSRFLRSRTAGMGLLASSAGVGKIAGIIAQAVLVSFLSPAELGLFATAFGIATVMASFADLSLDKRLLQRPELFAHAGASYRKLGLTIAAMVFGVICMSSPLIQTHYGDRTVAYLMIITGSAILCQSAIETAEVGLTLARRFDLLSLVRMLGALSRYGLVVLLAIMGAGAYALAIPIPASALIELGLAASFNRIKGAAAGAERTMRQVGREDGGTLRWLAGRSIGTFLVGSGDYVLISLVANKEFVGLYYFAYALVFTLPALAASAVDFILLPALSERAERGDMERNGTRWGFLAVTAAAAIGGAVALCIPALMSLAWGGRWSAASGGAIVFAIALPIHVSFNVLVSILEAAGRWRAAALAVGALGIVAPLGAMIGAFTAESVTVACAGSALGSLLVLVPLLVISCHMLGWRPLKVTLSWAAGLVPCMACLMVAFALRQLLHGFGVGQIEQTIFTVIAYAAPLMIAGLTARRRLSLSTT